MRRVAVEAYERMRRASSPTPSKRAIPSREAKSSFVAENKGGLTYLANIANRRAADFYRLRGAEKIAPAYELESPRGATLMFCRHCLRYAMGWCPQRGGKQSPYREPYTLVSADGKRFALTFDCKHCMMTVKEK